MTTRVVERRHREAAARARWPLAYSNGEPLANWLQAWVDQEADYTGVDGAALLAIANAIAAAEQPAPSPAEFDPWEALARAPGVDVGITHSCCDGLHNGGRVDITVDDGNGNSSTGETARAAAMGLCWQLGLTESPKGKEDANG